MCCIYLGRVVNVGSPNLTRIVFRHAQDGSMVQEQ